MKKSERKHRLALTLLASAIVFCVIFVAVILSAVTVFLLLDTGVISNLYGRRPDPKLSLLFMGTISLVIGFILTALISKFSLMPVNRIVNQMNRLADGDFKARLSIGKPLRAHPTIVEVTESFNKMAEELENTEVLRGDFINNFSHEFKTPIVSIAGFAKLLKRGNLTEEQRNEYIDIIEQESLRLAAMATNVLNLTKYENQTILTDVEAFNLSEQIRSAILTLEGKWSKKKIDFNLDLGEYTVEGNRDMLKHVWINLIDNAVKFSETGGSVDVSLHERDGQYEVTVKNRGPAISEDQQKKIFNKFYQADESHASEGNGIGLALVKGVCDLHGGEITVDSEDGITSFTVYLPKAR